MSWPTLRRTTAAWAAAVLTGGCAVESTGFERCDIRQSDCQQTTLRAVMALRGGATALPRLTVLNEASFLARARASEPDPAESAEAEAEAAERARWNRGLALFELAPAGYDDAQADADWASEVAAAYLVTTKEIVVVDRGTPLDDDSAVAVLAHEFVHALQDAEYDFARYGDGLPDTFDTELAVSSIVEGEAVLYQVLASATLMGLDTRRLDWDRFFSRYRDDALMDAEADDAPFTMARVRFPYAFGGDYVTQRWRFGGRGAIDELFDAPPLTTRAVMFKNLQPNVTSAQTQVQQAGVPELDPAFAEVGSTSLGAWMQRMFAARLHASDNVRGRSASGWTADWFSVQATENETIVAAWRQRTSDDYDLWARPGLLHAWIQGYADLAGRELFLVAADPAMPLAPDGLAWRPPAVTEATDSAATAAPPIDRRAFRHLIGCRRELPVAELAP